MRIAVLGGGVAGLATGLALAREGHQVVVLEGDPLEPGPTSAHAFSWERRGLRHFLQPHAFLPRGRKEMREHFPDVYRTMLEEGAGEVDLRPKIPGPTRDEDEELAFLAVRRPVIEWAFRRAVSAEEAIDLRGGVRVNGLIGKNGAVPEITGVDTSAGEVDADLVVDAMGRRSSLPDWLVALGGREPDTETFECGVMYYTRYYQLRDDAVLPDGPWIPSPRADLGYGAFASFPGDNHTLGVVLAIHPHDRELRALREPAAYEAAVATMKPLRQWLEAGDARPITDVIPMGSLHNTIRRFVVDREPIALGVVPVGDALCHTDPFGALGLSFSLIHATGLARAAGAHGRDPHSLALAFASDVGPEIEERFALMSGIDDARIRMWTGQSVDVAHRDGDYPLFTLAAAIAAGFVDPEIFRVAVRRSGMLDRTAVLDDDPEMQERIERTFAKILESRPPRPGPTRDELVEIVTASTE